MGVTVAEGCPHPAVASPPMDPEEPAPTPMTISDGTDTVTLTPGRNGWTVTLDVPSGADEARQRMLEAAGQALALNGGGRLEYWIDPVTDNCDRVPLSAGYTPFRDLCRLERPLPALPSDLTTRAFTLDDADAFLDVNNRAFAWHPEQRDQTLADLEARMAEPWFDADGFRIWDHEGAVGGFCWTKVHAGESPPVGEIYVIAVDPELHGQGLGRRLTLAGLEWLSAAGLRHAMLYVESDNRPANRVYDALGFERASTGRAYQRTVR